MSHSNTCPENRFYCRKIPRMQIPVSIVLAIFHHMHQIKNENKRRSWIHFPKLMEKLCHLKLAWRVFYILFVGIMNSSKMVFNWTPVCCQTAMLISGVCCHGDCRLLSRMAGIKDQQFTEEKPLLPETRGQEPEMVSVCVRVRYVCPWLNIVDRLKMCPWFFGNRTKNWMRVCVCMIEALSNVCIYWSYVHTFMYCMLNNETWNAKHQKCQFDKNALNISVNMWATGVLWS